MSVTLFRVEGPGPCAPGTWLGEYPSLDAGLHAASAGGPGHYLVHDGQRGRLLRVWPSGVVDIEYDDAKDYRPKYLIQEREWHLALSLS